jgi:Domain of unknown function (DUF3846)
VGYASEGRARRFAVLSKTRRPLTVAILLKPLSQNASKVEIVEPASGKAFSLEELQGFVDGYIELLRLEDGRCMFLNEEGKLKHLPPNATANRLAHQLTGIADDDYIVGNVVICSPQEAGDNEEEG